MVTVKLLEKLHIFEGISLPDLSLLAARCERKYYRPNQLIFREGEEADALYVVEVGTVEIISIAAEATVLAIVGSGGRFGDIAFFNGGTRPASARAREATHAVSIPYVAVQQLLQVRPTFALAFYPNASRSLARRLGRTLHDLSYARAVAA